MSKIVAFRERICEAIRQAEPDLEVDWYDGLFDAEDIEEWTLKTPCARVAILQVPTEHHSTMEMNLCLRCVVVIIDENKNVQRDGDGRAWGFVENIAVLANLNAFGDENAAPATKIQFKILSQPQLRREGISVGVVEWESGLTIGRNRVVERDFFYHNGRMITQVPQSNVSARSRVHARGLDGDEVCDVTPETD